jgi:hypothetical protein
MTPKANSLVGAEKAEIQNLAREAEKKTENSEVHPPPSDSNGNAPFAAILKLNDRLSMLHAALPSPTTLFLFYGHSDPRLTSTPAACRAEYQASLNPR